MLKRNTGSQLLAAVRRAGAGSDFWQRRFAAAGLDPDAPNALAAWSSLPLLDKPELLQDQQSQPDGGSLRATPMTRIRRLHRTSGSTSTPFIVMLTAHDIAVAQSVGGRALRCAGVREGELVVHCLNYQMWSGGVTDHLCFEAAGAAVIPYGIGNSRYLVETIQRLRPSAISCTPSYLMRLRDLCRDELGIDPRSLGLRAAFLGGEGGLQQIDYRRQLEETWGMLAVDANYGLSEVLSIFASECGRRCGLHFHAEGALLPELVDPQGNALALAPGTVGELVVSTLEREAQPLFRYRTHDRIEILAAGCDCGLDGFLFRVLGRTDDMLIVKGVNFYPASLLGVLASLGPGLFGDFRVSRPASALDPVRVRVEAASVAGPEAVALAARIVQQIAQQCSVTVEVELVPPGTFPRSENKTPKVI